MFKEWLKDDIEKAAQKSNRVVISDPSRFLTFAVKDLPDYAVLTLNSEAEEMAARHQAQTAHANSKVLFLCFFPAKEISQLVEFSGIGGFINFDNPDTYLRDKIFHKLNQNVTIPEPKLLLSAMLSEGKSLAWWRGIVNETIEPLDLKQHLHMLILDPEKYQTNFDERVISVLRDEVFKAIGRPAVPLDPPALLRELYSAIFSGLLEGKLNPSLSDIYYWWSNTNDLLPSLRDLASAWTLPGNALPAKAHPDHPFESLDRLLLTTLAKRLRDNDSIVDLTEAVRKRVASPRVAALKPKWLNDLLTLLDFDSSEIYLYATMKKITDYYANHFASLDTALRHLYDRWLSEPELLRPLQEIYETHMKALLGIWFAVVPPKYAPTQLGLIEAALTSASKVAVLVCDGLRLEIAEAVVKKLSGNLKMKKRVEYAKLPTVTENGMSALFGLDSVETSVTVRYNNLRPAVPDASIIPYLSLGNATKAKRLVVMFGDIDTVGEHKGLAGLRDINNYETELAEAVKRLHQMGYKNVFLTADHGFVITGLLDEASKVAAPAGVDVKERFFLTNDYIDGNVFIRREDKFPGSEYQYYSKTDKPFRTKGAYGYAHGGFTPQECLIPFYCISSLDKHTDLEVKISNKDSLSSVSGQYFTVYLKGNSAAAGKRVKVILYNNGVEESTIIIKLNSNGEADCEFEIVADTMSLIVQDTATNIQLDNASVGKAMSRDLDDLFL